MRLTLSRHAVACRAERSVSQVAIEVLFSYGKYRHNGRGAIIVTMDSAGRAKARQELGRAYDRVGTRLDFAAIVRDGVVLTFVRRHGRLKLDGLPRKRLRTRQGMRRNRTTTAGRQRPATRTNRTKQHMLPMSPSRRRRS